VLLLVTMQPGSQLCDAAHVVHHPDDGVTDDGDFKSVVVLIAAYAGSVTQSLSGVPRTGWSVPHAMLPWQCHASQLHSL
jgi:hypothetical protein